MRVYAIDPGTTKSALVVLRDGAAVVHAEIADNVAVNSYLRYRMDREAGDALVIEKIASYGMAVGEDVFTTVWWSGRFAEAWLRVNEAGSFAMLERRAVKLHLCNSMRAKDPNIRQALIDRFGGSAAIARPTKKRPDVTPGPLVDIHDDLWAALAIGVTYYDQQQPQRARA